MGENKVVQDNGNQDVLIKRLFKDRKRTNVLSGIEQVTISWLVRRIPSFISPDMLTVIGFLGSCVVLAGFTLASFYGRNYLLLTVAGLALNWFGDSLDGRIAYYRNIPRKWYGFSLDIIMDWASTVLIGLGYMVYVEQMYQPIGFVFVVLYAWAMIISQLRYKITDIYSIDAGLVGPTEIRIILSLIFIFEMTFGHVLEYCAAVLCMILFLINFMDTRKLLKLGDLRDEAERKGI